MNSVKDSETEQNKEKSTGGGKAAEPQLPEGVTVVFHDDPEDDFDFRIADNDDFDLTDG